MKPEVEEEGKPLKKKPRKKTIIVEPLIVTLYAKKGSGVATRANLVWNILVVIPLTVYGLMFDGVIN